MHSPIEKIKARWEYLRSIRFELGMLPRCDRIQVCTAENRRYLESFAPGLKSRIDDGLRAGISTRNYAYPGGPRTPYTILFLGSFRHVPNQVALEWFSRHVLPIIVERCPQAKLLVAGSDPLPRHAYHDPLGAIEMLRFVEDIQPLFAQAAVFVCPIRSGSGVRVKLLEAFAAGIPVVSTRVGAEGLAHDNGQFCSLSDEPEEFARQVLEIFDHPELGAQMAARARAEVETNWDMEVITGRLLESYRLALAEKRATAAASETKA
jgi:glycosyltransferase involved in cell wall biosynthesis